MRQPAPARGDVWLAGARPIVVVSNDAFNSGPSNLVMAVPLTMRERRVKLDVPVEAGEGGLRVRTFIMCDNIKSTSRDRLIRRFGSLDAQTMEAVEDRLRILLSL